MSKQTVGVVGHGFVGQAVAAGLCSFANVTVYDKDPEKGLFGLEECVEGWSEAPVHLPTPQDVFPHLINKCHIIFVCVPTPMNADKSCDTSIVEGVVKKLDATAAAAARVPRPVVVIKSTVPPGTTAKLQEKCQWVDLVFNPEFLTEKNSMGDFADQSRVILGGADGQFGLAVDEVATLYREFGLARQARLIRGSSLGSITAGSPIIQSCSSTEAEMIKYLTNCFLATKVSLANEFSQLCDKVEANWDTVWRLASDDERLGKTHWQVPGPDGKPGFGGSCFPKDVCGMIEFMMDNEVDPLTLLGAWHKNLEVRSEQDWEKLKGRAVT